MKRPRVKKRVRLSEQLKSVTLIKAPVGDCASAIKTKWARFGPPSDALLANWPAIKEFLLPLKSFKTRVVLAPFEEVTLIVTDMFGESAFVNALAASKILRAEVLGANLQDERRIIQYADSGEVVREIAYYVEEGAWVYASKGAPLSCEREIGLKEESLTLSSAVEIVKQTMNVEWPPVWSELRDAIGLTRSLSTLRVRVLDWTTIDDT
jgi:hypothetical protein